MTYYFELVEQEKGIEKQGKYFFNENKKDYLKLLKCRSILHQQWKYEQRQNYFELMDDYLNKKFDAENFNLLFYRIWFKNRDQSTLLEQDFRRKSVS